MDSKPHLVCRKCGQSVGATAHHLQCPKFLTPGPVVADVDAVCAGCGFLWSPWCCGKKPPLPEPNPTDP